jgi:hypothetical protein
VSGIGVVHDYERWSNDWNKFLDHFKDADGKINGCTIAREKRPKMQATMGETEKAHVFVIRRIMGLQDDKATGIVFDDHLEVLGDAFNGNETLNETCRTINPDWGPMTDAVGLQIELVEIRMFGGILCHYAECRLCAIEAQEI